MRLETGGTCRLSMKDNEVILANQSFCPVCCSGYVRPFRKVGERAYWRCHDCLATYLDIAQQPDPASERAVYELHENDPDNSGYRAFVSRLWSQLKDKLPEEAHGLDYGCGPGSALAAIASEDGHEMSLYDPFFAPNREALEQTYDFVTCTEVAEHFHDPAGEFVKLDRLLRPGGWLGIMTQFQTEDARFEQWHYRRDPTHVVFYRPETLTRLAERFGWQVEFPCKDVALFHKSAG